MAGIILAIVIGVVVGSVCGFVLLAGILWCKRYDVASTDSPSVVAAIWYTCLARRGL